MPGKYYVRSVKASHEGLRSVFGPYPRSNAKTYARIRSSKGGPQEVWRGRPYASGSSLDCRYRGGQRLEENPVPAVALWAGGILAGLGALWLILRNRQLSKPTGPCAVLGDSMAAGGGIGRFLEGATGVSWANLGVVGEGTRAILARTPADGRYQHVVVIAGANDFGSLPASTTISNLGSIYKTLRAGGSKVIAITPTPMAGYAGMTPEKQAKLDAVRAWIMSGASGLADIVVDSWYVLEDPSRPGHLNQARDAGDHLHLTMDGQRVLGSLVNMRAY